MTRDVPGLLLPILLLVPSPERQRDKRMWGSVQCDLIIYPKFFFSKFSFNTL